MSSIIPLGPSHPSHQVEETLHVLGLEERVLFFLFQNGGGRRGSIVVTGADNQVVVQCLEAIQAFVHLLRVTAGQVAPAAAADEQGIPRNQAVGHLDALGAGSVPRRVEERELQRADGNLPASLDRFEVGLPYRHVVDLFLMDDNLGVGGLQDFGQAVDVVEVRVRDDDRGDAHFVLGGDVEDPGNVPGRVDYGRFPGFERADQVDEILKGAQLKLF